jgi:hypothetical protein
MSVTSPGFTMFPKRGWSFDAGADGENGRLLTLAR